MTPQRLSSLPLLPKIRYFYHSSLRLKPRGAREHEAEVAEKGEFAETANFCFSATQTAMLLLPMTANSPLQATPQAAQAVAWLGPRLPRGWTVEAAELPPHPGQSPADGRINLHGPNGTVSTIVLEEKQSLSPRGVLSQLAPRLQTARDLGGHLPLLVVAPWLSRRTRELLAAADINYLDSTGNALLRVDNPPFFLQTTGAERNPSPSGRAGAKLRGAKASRVIRLLLDVRPPYGVLEISQATGLNRGYVSRLVEAIYREGLIERRPRGPVEEVDVPALLNRWTESYDVFRANQVESFVAPAGAENLLGRLAADPGLGTRIVISGSFAAARLAPIAAPALLLLYADSARPFAADLELLPAEEGANVMVLRPFDHVVFERTRVEDGLRYAAPSQIAADCLSGNGRMPAEGEALLQWMTNHEPSWRLPSISDLDREAP